MMDPNQLIFGVTRFIDSCRMKQNPWAYSSVPNGGETLYATCFAVMTLHYIGALDKYSLAEREAWADYINSWQDPETGLFIGPEFAPDDLLDPRYTRENLLQHLTCLVLPALKLLGARPCYPLHFAHVFTNLDYLKEWLNARDWHDAWWEGNNLLFVGQFLVHLRDYEQISAAGPAVQYYLEWLDREVDPMTGLWGTNGYCSHAWGVYGGYHQLLVYYYEEHPVISPERLIDVVLDLQHIDGGFNLEGGGGACQDVDAIDILVSLYQQVDYRRPQVRRALRLALRSILKRQMPDGGFVYRMNEPFDHMGIRRTASPPNASSMFTTWFRVHTLALISQILTDEAIARMNWKFNEDLSMGWHRIWASPRLASRDRWQETTSWDVRTARKLARDYYGQVRSALHALRCFLGRYKRRMLRIMYHS